METMETPDLPNKSIKVKPIRRKRWFDENEIKRLCEGVKEYGTSDWISILNWDKESKSAKFCSRSNVDLKDKWRNMFKQAKKNQQAKYLSPIDRIVLATHKHHTELDAINRRDNVLERKQKKRRNDNELGITPKRANLSTPASRNKSFGSGTAE